MRPPLRLRSSLILLLLPSLLAGCRAVAPAPTTAPAAANSAPASTDALPDEVHWVRTSAEYLAILTQTYRLAGERLAHKAAGLEPGTWAVSVDADETVISNSLHEKERFLAGGVPFSWQGWGAWVARREATVLPGAISFLQQVRQLGGRIAIVTNRRMADCRHTEANLIALAIPFDVLLCKPDEGGSEKEPRWRRVEEGTASPDLPALRIVMWLGDNIRDFPGLGQQLRDGAGQDLARFGDDFFLLPNPMYGSWESNPPN